MAEKKDILVIDDEPRVHQILKSKLQRYGYLLDGVTSSEEAFVAVKKKKYDLVILEHGIPDTDEGVVYIEKLKEAMEKGEIPIIIFTNRRITECESACEKAGVYTVVPKPELFALVFQIKQLFDGKVPAEL